MAINAEQLNIILAARDKEFTKAMDRSQRRVERFAKQSQKNLNKAGQSFNQLAMVAKRLAPVIGGAALLSSIKNVTEQMDEIGKKADQIGITTDSLQQLRAAGVSAGVSQEKLTSSLERFSKRLGEASMGTGAANKVLQEMGLSASELQSMGLDGALDAIADKMAAIQDPTERAAKAAAIFGREGVAMVNMLRNGSSGLDDFREKANAAGAVIDEKLIREAEKAQDEIDFAARIIRAQLSTALVELIPIVVAGAEGFASLVKNVVTAIDAVQGFLNPNEDLEKSIDNVVLAMADEIRQSRQLEIQLGQSQEMSVGVARQKLAEAEARHANAAAAMEEARAITLQSPQYQSMAKQLRTLQDTQRGIAATDDLVPLSKSEQYETLGQQIIETMGAIGEMLDVDQELLDQLDRTGGNIDKLRAALQDAKDGIVSFGDAITVPITKSDRLNLSTSNTSNSLQGLIDKLEYGTPTISAFGAQIKMTEVAMDRLSRVGETLEQSMEDALMSIVDGSASAKDAFKTMTRSIIQDLYRQYLVKQITGFFGGMFGFATGSSAGSYGLPSFGGGGVSGGAPAGLSLVGAASGRSVSAGRPYMTSEHGRELFVPSSSGRVLSVAQTKDAVSGGAGDIIVQQTINVSTGVQQTVRTEIKTLMPQIADAAKAAVADAKRRGGSYGRAMS